MEKEILLELNISDEDKNLINLHSFLNILNVLNAEIYYLDIAYKSDVLLTNLLTNIISISESLRNKEESFKIVSDIDNFISLLDSTINKYIEKNNLNEIIEIIEIKSNISNIIKVLRIRAQEILSRIGRDEEWRLFYIKDLEYDFNNFFAAVEKNSKGKYRIVYNIAEHEEKSYLVNLSFNSYFGDKIYMPLVFKDVMRDLLANARKYTPPGGRITSGLVQTENELKFVVEDTGLGIPEEEIENCVGFGYRGTNVTNIVTKGGGFGLTKAYLTTKQFNGRMWIKSELEKGTSIRISIPNGNIKNKGLKIDPYASRESVL